MAEENDGAIIMVTWFCVLRLAFGSCGSLEVSLEWRETRRDVPFQEVSRISNIGQMSPPPPPPAPPEQSYNRYGLVDSRQITIPPYLDSVPAKYQHAVLYYVLNKLRNQYSIGLINCSRAAARRNLRVFNSSSFHSFFVREISMSGNELRRDRRAPGRKVTTSRRSQENWPTQRKE